MALKAAQSSLTLAAAPGALVYSIVKSYFTPAVSVIDALARVAPPVMRGTLINCCPLTISFAPPVPCTVNV